MPNIAVIKPRFGKNSLFKFNFVHGYIRIILQFKSLPRLLDLR